MSFACKPWVRSQHKGPAPEFAKTVVDCFSARKQSDAEGKPPSGKKKWVWGLAVRALGV